MAWTNITKPSVGDPTKKVLIDAIIDNDAFLYNQFLSVVGNREVVLNGSFESDADGDSYPDGWTRTLHTGGSFTWDLSTSAADGKAFHGKRSAKFTSPGGGGNGGGTLTSESFFEVTEGRAYQIEFALKSSAADVHNVASISFYDCTQTLISTTTIYDEASVNPTSWSEFRHIVVPPANSRYAKLGFDLCKNDDTTAGSTWVDDVRMQSFFPRFERRLLMDTPGSYKWKCPVGVRHIAVLVIGGGGGGGTGAAGGSDGGGGGGAGGLVYDIQAVTQGTSYAFTVGSGGAGSAAGSGSDGATGVASVFTGSATLTANGGVGGEHSAGSPAGGGGAGGTASGGDVNETGESGDNRSGNTGGDGGAVSLFGLRAVGGQAGGAQATDGASYGAGGGGGKGGGATFDGGDGGGGLVLILW